jgi:large subunit ribosomal protein L22
MKVKAKLKSLRIAPRKSKLVADLIRGLDVKEALKQLGLNVKKTSQPVKKLLLDAIANGENNWGIDKNNMYVYDVKVGAGPMLKRWMPKAFGRAGKILKRTSRLEIILEERIENKGRKTKEEMEAEKKKRLKEKEEEMKKAEEKNEDDKENKKKSQGKNFEKKEKTKETEKKSWGSRIFRRKSM